MFCLSGSPGLAGGHWVWSGALPRPCSGPLLHAGAGQVGVEGLADDHPPVLRQYEGSGPTAPHRGGGGGGRPSPDGGRLHLQVRRGAVWRLTSWWYSLFRCEDNTLSMSHPSKTPRDRPAVADILKRLKWFTCHSRYSQINEGEVFKNYSTFCWMCLLWSKGELHHEYLYEIEMHFF